MFSYERMVNMRMKRSVIPLIAAAMLLTACSGASETSNLQYVSDPAELVESEDGTSTPAEGDPSINDMRTSGQGTCDSKYIYTPSFNYKINIDDYTIAFDCDKPGCNHRTEDCDGRAPGERYLNNRRAYNGGFYYLSDDGVLSYIKDKEITQIYKNTYVSEYEKHVLETNPYATYDPGSIDHFYIVSDGIICEGCNYIFKVGFDGTPMSEVIEPLKDSGLELKVLDSDTVLCEPFSVTESGIDDSGDVFTVTLSTGEVIPHPEYIFPSFYIDGKSYFVKDSDEMLVSDMYVGDGLEAKDQKMLIHDYGFSHTYSEDAIYYVPYLDNTKLYKYDIATGENTVLFDLEKIADEQEPVIDTLDEALDVFGSYFMELDYYPNAQKLSVSLNGGHVFLIFDKDGKNASLVGMSTDDFTLETKPVYYEIKG